MTDQADQAQPAGRRPASWTPPRLGPIRAIFSGRRRRLWRLAAPSEPPSAARYEGDAPSCAPPPRDSPSGDPTPRDTPPCAPPSGPLSGDPPPCDPPSDPLPCDPPAATAGRDPLRLTPRASARQPQGAPPGHRPGEAPPPRPPGPGLAAPRPRGELRTWPRSFAHRLTSPLPGVRAIARLAREGRLRPPVEALRQIPDLPFEPGPQPVVGPGDTAVTWAGHASCVLRTGGLTVLTDPVWSRRILGTPARVTPVGVRWEDLPPIDAVVISHNHYDHLDAPTLRRLPRDTPLFVPAGLAVWCRARRFTDVTELDWWEAAEVPGPDGPVRFDFVPAHHWSKRTLTDTCRSLWGGWVITAPGGGRTYFAGDTGYGHWFREIGRRYPGIDLALLPIGAYDPRWMLRPVHTDPEEAVRAFGDLGARMMMPMHWSTFLLSAEPPLQPLFRVRAAWEAAGLAREALWDLPVGGSRVLDRDD